MSLEFAKCPNCGSTLEVDNSNDMWICNHCDSAIIVEEAIKNYNITNDNNNMCDDNSDQSGRDLSDFVIHAGILEKYVGVSTEVVIPNSVIRIGDSSFYDCISLTSITIPNSVTSIGIWAFSGCSRLSCINIPNSVTSIEFGAFSSCSSLTIITIPDSVTNTETDALFWGCSSLTNVTMPNSITRIGTRAFSGCCKLTSISIPDGVTEIENLAFESCSSLTNITIPNNVTRIGENAFSGCSSLSCINIPDSVTSIGNDAFKGCSNLTQIYFSANLSLSDSVFMDTPYFLKREEDRRMEEYSRIKKGECRHCGGKFKGLFSKACSRCGKTKDY